MARVKNNEPEAMIESSFSKSQHVQKLTFSGEENKGHRFFVNRDPFSNFPALS